jgi:hypothetical protein
MATTILEVPDVIAQKIGSHTTIDQFIHAYFTMRHDHFPEGDIDEIDGTNWVSYPVNMPAQDFLAELKQLL